MKNSIILLFVLFSIEFSAQVIIKGVVSDDMGPIADISVKVKGTVNVQ